MREDVARSKSLLVRVSPALSCLMLVLALSGGGVVLAEDAGLSPWPWQTMTPKPLPNGESAPPVPRIQGDTVGYSFILESIPSTATGSTCSYNNDYDYACPYETSTARDVVYKYVCTADIPVDIDLCASTYDTKVYVFEDDVDNVIACNDDHCAYQSYISNLPLTAGHTYYIVIDGYGTSCGDYDLRVGPYEECVLECPPRAIPEGEPECHQNYNDSYNSGCCCWPEPTFVYIGPSVDPIVICGTTGVFYYDTVLYRDSDWYQIDLTESAEICLTGNAEVSMYYFIIDGRGGCDDVEIVAYDTVGPCAQLVDLCYFCGEGTWWLWAGPMHWDLAYVCGSMYWMEITGYRPEPSSVPEEDPSSDTTWGRVKGLFR